MSIYKSIREQLGLSQNDLAVLLGTNRSQLSHAELGTREIGAHGLFTLAELIPHWQEAIASPVQHPQPDEDALAAAKEQAALCRIKLYPLKKQAEQMRRNYEKAMLRQKALSPLLENPKLTPGQKKGCEFLLGTAETMIRENGPAKQWLLNLQIEALEREMALYEQAVG
jgi:transcriptional regulator with XRE-family HTH domain